MQNSFRHGKAVPPPSRREAKALSLRATQPSASGGRGRDLTSPREAMGKSWEKRGGAVCYTINRK